MRTGKGLSTHRLEQIDLMRFRNSLLFEKSWEAGRKEIIYRRLAHSEHSVPVDWWRNHHKQGRPVLFQNPDHFGIVVEQKFFVKLECFRVVCSEHQNNEVWLQGLGFFEILLVPVWFIT